MTSIVEFLEARIAEDETAAHSTARRVYVDSDGCLESPAEQWADGEDRLPNHHNVWHLVFDPARVLREVAIKRDMLDVDRPGFGKDGVICNGHPGPFMNHGDYGPGYCAEPDEFSSWYKLAWAYKDHPDYRPEWLDRTPRYDR